VNVVLRGIGAHGAQPQAGKDPIVMAGEFIVQLQTIVSRQENPRDPSIVTIGSIHGGTKRNIIPNEVKMEITARAYTHQARQVILDGIRRTAQGVALSAGVPEDLAPIVTVLDAESTPVMYNDPKLTARVRAALVRALGAQNVIDEEPGTASEDFGILGLEGRKIPTMMFGLGAIDPGKFAAAAAEGKLVPGPHNSRFEPAPEPTLRTGVTAMSAVAIALLQ
jgi:hippurate hydrolase